MKLCGIRKDGVVLISMVAGQMNLLDPRRALITPCFDASLADGYGPWAEIDHSLDARRAHERVVASARTVPLITLRNPPKHVEDGDPPKHTGDEDPPPLPGRTPAPSPFKAEPVKKEYTTRPSPGARTGRVLDPKHAPMKSAPRPVLPVAKVVMPVAPPMSKPDDDPEDDAFARLRKAKLARLKEMSDDDLLVMLERDEAAAHAKAWDTRGRSDGKARPAPGGSSDEDDALAGLTEDLVGAAKGLFRKATGQPEKSTWNIDSRGQPVPEKAPSRALTSAELQARSQRAHERGDPDPMTGKYAPETLARLKKEADDDPSNSSKRVRADVAQTRATNQAAREADQPREDAERRAAAAKVFEKLKRERTSAPKWDKGSASAGSKSAEDNFKKWQGGLKTPKESAAHADTRAAAAKAWGKLTVRDAPKEAADKGARARREANEGNGAALKAWNERNKRK